jgi:hypothetical protein
MITAEKLRIYESYSGDMDGWARVRDASGLRAMTDQDWFDIGELLQRLSLQKSVPVAESYRAATAQLPAERVADSATANRLKEIAS